MRLIKFKAKNLHGRLSFEISFNSDLTLLTGRNGSGKSTVLECIQALLTPSVASLCRLDYEEMQVDFKVGKERHWIRAVSLQDTGKISLTTSLLQQPCNIDRGRLETMSPLRLQERFESLSLFKIIQQIPTPLFLSTNRLFTKDDYEREFSISHRYHRLRDKQDVVPGLKEAIVLVQKASAEDKTRQLDILKNFQEELISDVLLPDPSRSPYAMLGTPLTEEDKQLPRRIENIISDMDALGLKLKSLTRKGRELAGEAKELIGVLGNVKNLTVHDHFEEQVRWVGLKSRSSTLIQASSLLDKWKMQRDKVARPVQTFLTLINRFFQDTGKEIILTPEVKVKIIANKQVCNLDVLSSGEAQLFIILANLSFMSKPSNNLPVYIIDEPEISLHIRWQEIFIYSLKEANPEAQFVIATHSPSIIADWRHCCVAVSGEPNSIKNV